jgi:TPR repeat protein
MAEKEGVAKDCNRAFELVEVGARLGCHHCQGVMAECYLNGYGCEQDDARSIELARESSGKGSRYGQFTLGWLYDYGEGGVAQDYDQAVALYRLAAAQNLDWAQLSLGNMYHEGFGVVEDYTEALRLYHLAAAQGCHFALFNVAESHKRGRGVRKNKDEAIRWYRRAQAAGHPNAVAHLQSLRA